jgi:hypothetical protein
MIRDEKYIVFKRDDWNQSRSAGGAPAQEVTDAVVIRTQDIFAGPALHGYAAAISIATKILTEDGWPETAGRLQAIADYFHERAVEADEGPRKIPD